MKQVSCIIPAYNEASRISAVLSVVVGHPSITEVIVVDDGSSDGTADAVRAFPSVRLLINTPNRGKSASVARGMREAVGEYILMLDADLAGLTAENVTALIEPVVQGRVAVAMSLRGNSLRTYKWLGMDFFTGERIFAKTLVEDGLSLIEKLPGYFLETHLNALYVRNNCTIRVVRWKNVTQTRKTAKVGFIKGELEELQMASTLAGHGSFVHDVLIQNYKLLTLSRT